MTKFKRKKNMDFLFTFKNNYFYLNKSYLNFLDRSDG